MAKIKKTPTMAAAGDQKRKGRGTPDRRNANVTVTIDRRLGERREKVNRRRQIDPTTCERDYTNDEVEFMHAPRSLQAQERPDVPHVQRSVGSDSRPGLRQD